MQENRPGKTKKRRATRGDGERRPVTRKRKRKEVVEEDLSLLPPEEGADLTNFIRFRVADDEPQHPKGGWINRLKLS